MHVCTRSSPLIDIIEVLCSVKLRWQHIHQSFFCLAVYLLTQHCSIRLIDAVAALPIHQLIGVGAQKVNVLLL